MLIFISILTAVEHLELIVCSENGLDQPAYLNNKNKFSMFFVLLLRIWAENLELMLFRNGSS